MTSDILRKTVDSIATVCVTVASISITWAITTGHLLPTDSLQSSASQRAANVEDVKAQRLSMSLSDATILGQIKPGVVVVEFSDFECPFCGQYARTTFRQLRELAESGSITYGFVNFPLTEIHHRATDAAKAALCAGEQHRFWDMHEILFANQRAFGQEDLLRYAAQLSLNRGSFEACTTRTVTSGGRALGTRLGVGSTPTFLLGTLDAAGVVTIAKRMRGAEPYASFKAAIDELKAEATTQRKG